MLPPKCSVFNDDFRCYICSPPPPFHSLQRLKLLALYCRLAFFRLSSAGLVYAHFGMEVISEILTNKNYAPTTDCLQHVYLAVYDNFVEELDAIDNGIPMYPEGKPRYKISTHLSARVHRLNPEWNTRNPEHPDKLFQKALEMVGNEFVERVLDVSNNVSRSFYYYCNDIPKLML